MTILASVDAALDTSAVHLGLVDGNQILRALVLLTDVGSYTRSDGCWQPLNPDVNESDAGLDQYDAYDAPSTAVPLWDSAQRNNGTMTLTDIYGTPEPATPAAED
jgi:hypothetical protein